MKQITKNDNKNKINPVALVADKLGAWLLLIVIFLVMPFLSDKFLVVDNIINVLRQICVVGIAAIGVSFIILGGGFDLSTGMIATFSACNAAAFVVKVGLPLPISLLLAIVIGVCIGTLNGVFITFCKLPPFIATLGMQYIINGLIMVTTKTIPITGLPDAFLALGRGYIADWLPVPVVILLVFVVMGHVLLKYTIFGRSIIAIGENETAAKLSGLNVNLVKVSMYAFSAMCASCAGIVLAGRLSSAQPTSGADLALQALAGVYIGGTFKGSIINTLAGALVWGFMNNSLNLLNVNAYWQKVALGIIIIIAVLFDSFRANLAAKQKS